MTLFAIDLHIRGMDFIFLTYKILNTLKQEPIQDKAYWVVIV